jgi:cytochrome c oxidase subunit III
MSQDKPKHDDGHGGGGDHGHGDGHHHGSRFIQHHYDGAQHQFDSGKLGIWLFLVQEVLFFSALFVAYILYRSHRPEIYSYAHHYLDTTMGAINTAVLIFSSLTAAWAVRCAQLNQRKGLILCLSLTIVCACAFLGIKYVEYSHKIHEGILFGNRFDPCVSSGGGPLVTKSNMCHGTKSSVLYDRGKSYSKTTIPDGCLVADKIDLDPRRDGIQASCKVQEVKFTRDAKGVMTDGASQEIEVCPTEPAHGSSAHAAKSEHEAGHGGGHGKACWKLSSNPNICPTGPAVLVHYGDHKIHQGVKIVATCDAPKPAEVGDTFADKPSELALGKSTIAAERPKTKHELQHEFSMGPPPPNTGMFFSIYFAMTGLHGIHVLVGIFVFIWLLFRAVRNDFNSEYFGPVDYAALYWHIVDLIWIFLFPLLYLIH